MNNFQWYSKLARFAEEHPGLGDIKYGQMNLIAEFVAKEEAAQQLRAPDASLGVWLHCMTCGQWHLEKESCIPANRERR